MRRHQQQNKKKPRSRREAARREPLSGLGRRELSSPPRELHLVDELAMKFMSPGDIILLDETEHLRAAVDAIFFAVLACPACGTLGLITASQYLGRAPITCVSNHCSCRFRIHEGKRYVYLPVN